MVAYLAAAYTASLHGLVAVSGADVLRAKVAAAHAFYEMGVSAVVPCATPIGLHGPGSLLRGLASSRLGVGLDGPIPKPVGL